MPRIRPLYALLLLAALGGVVWFLLSLDDEPEPAPIRTILLITPDTLRRDYVGVYRTTATLSSTPHMDALAKTSVRFDHAVAPVPLTLPSHLSMLSGAPPPITGIRTNASPPVPPEALRGYPLLAERLRAGSWRCGAFVSAGVLASRYGLNQGFHTYDDEALDDPRGYAVTERRGEHTAKRALQWLRKQDKTARVFLWVHLFDAHAPYDEDSTYRGGVKHVDRVVGQLLDGLRDAGRAHDAAILLAADHGEALGDLGEASHGILLSEGTLRVPMLLRAPGLAPGTRSDLARLEDVAPTLAALGGVPWPTAASVFEGRDLLASRRHGTAAGVSESAYGFQRYRWAQLVGVPLDSGGMVIDVGHARLHSLPRYDETTGQGGPDPLADTEPVRAALRSIAQYKQLTRGADPLPPGEMLTNSYYTGSDPIGTLLAPEANARLPDPYRSVGIQVQLDMLKQRAAMSSTGVEGFRAILARLDQMDAANPENPEIPFFKGRTLDRQRAAIPERGLAEAARDAYVEALRRGRTTSMTLILAANAEAGRTAHGDSPQRRAAAGLALLDAWENTVGPPDCQRLILRIRFLKSRGAPGDDDLVKSTCAQAEARCRTPKQSTLRAATCGG